MFKEINPNSKRTAIMEKEFVPYEQALALKELGFDEPCFKKYYKDENGVGLVGDECTNTSIKSFYKYKNKHCSTPLYQQSFRWFRKNYKLWYMVYPRDGWNYHIQGIGPTISCDGESWSKMEIPTYGKAELECLKKLIQIVKEKK